MEDRKSSVGYEYIGVWIHYDKNGNTQCICKKENKCPNRKCSMETVVRDRYSGWQSVMRVNKYGK